MHNALSPSDLILVGSGFISLLTIVGLFIRLTWWLSKQFSALRNLSYKLHSENNKRFIRLELWANRRGFQPGVDNPLDFNGNGPLKEEDFN